LEQLARDVAPSIKALRGKLAGPIREASTEIRKFLEEMLGEHAAAVAMAVAQNAAATPRTAHGGHAQNSAVKPHASHGSHAVSHPGSSSLAPPASRGRQHETIAEKARTQAKVSASTTTSAVQRLAYEGYSALNFAAKGLMGEHIVEHHVIEHKNWGLDWNAHDHCGSAGGGKAPGWQNEFKKINDAQTPLSLCTPTAHVLASGIDSAWFTNRAKPHQFAIVEAKANMNPSADLLQLLGEAKDKSNTGKNRTDKILQMSETWVDQRIERDLRRWETRMKDNYSRHVFLVTPIQAAEHTVAMSKIIEEGLISKPAAAQGFAKDHAVHNVQREFTATDIDAAVSKYKQSGKPKSTTKPRKSKK